MLSTSALAWLEKAGIRKVFFFAPNGRVESVLPMVGDAPKTPGYSAQLLNEKVEASRYFAISNAVRLGLHLPIVVMFFLFGITAIAPAVLFTIFCLWHALLVFLEFYKTGILFRIPPDPEAKGVPGEAFEPSPWGDNWFVPKPWETEKFYRRLGLPMFQKITLFYIYVARLSRKERRQGKQIEFVKHKNFSELARFEAGTRIGEMVHSYFVGFDVIPVVYAVLHHNPAWIGYTLFILWGDSWLVLLQRYHRVRIWKTFVRYRERAAKQRAEEPGTVSTR